MKINAVGSKIAKFLGDNAVDLAAGAVVVGGAVAVAKAGTAAVTTTCLVGGGIAAGFVAFGAAKGVITTVMLAPAAMRRMYAHAREAMDRPDLEQKAA